MESLLKNDFIKHHSLSDCNIPIAQKVNHSYFEIDDVARKLIVRSTPSNGMVKYENPHNKEVAIIDYDGFLSNTITAFQHGKKRCDVIVHTTNEHSYFLLNELKEKNPTNPLHVTSNIEDAKLQILDTLSLLNTVPSIQLYIQKYTVKICSYCNSFPKSNLPLISDTINAFNRLSTLTPNGIQLSEPRIEAYGFIYIELKGNQTMKLN
jgi:hypothetical protein